MVSLNVVFPEGGGEGLKNKQSILEVIAGFVVKSEMRNASITSKVPHIERLN